MTAIAIGSSAALRLADGGTIRIASNGGFFTVAVTPIAGSATTTNYGSAPVRTVVGPYSEGATVVVSNQSAPSLDYDATGAGIDYFVSASGDTTGATDTVAINAVLQPGSWVRLQDNATFTVNAPLVMPSNCRLTAGPNTTIRLANSANKNLLQTAAYASGSDVSVTLAQSGTTVTVTWTAHGRSVGDFICINGTTQSIYNGVFRVASVTNANTLTYSLERLPSASPTGSSVARVATSNFIIEGGIWDGNYANGNNAAGSITAFGFMLFYAAQFQVRDRKHINQSKYCLCIAMARDFRVFNEVWDTNSDGIKVYGPARHGHISDCYGITADDCVSLQPKENDSFPAFQIMYGDIEHVDVENIHSACTTGTGVAGVFLYAGFTVDAIKFRNLHGAGGNVGFIRTNASGDPFELIEFDGLYGMSGSSGTGYVFSAGGSPTGKKLVLKNLAQVPQSTTANYALGVLVSGTVDTVEIDGFYLNNTSSPASVDYLLSIGSTTRKLLLKNFYLRPSNDLRVFAFGSNVIDEIIADGWDVAGGDSMFTDTGTNGWTPKVSIIGCRISGANIMFSANNPNSYLITLLACKFSEQGTADVRAFGSGCTVTVSGFGNSFSASGLVAGGGGVVQSTLIDGAQSPAYAASYTPDLAAGGAITVGTLTGAIAVNNASNTPPAGTQVSFTFTQDGTGGRNVTWGTNYVFPTAWSNTGNTAGLKSTIAFVSDGAKLRAMGANSWA